MNLAQVTNLQDMYVISILHHRYEAFIVVFYAFAKAKSHSKQAINSIFIKPSIKT